MSVDAHVVVRRGPLAVDVALEVADGEVLAVLGPNGAGKSSMVLAVGGVLRIVRPGSVEMDGTELAGKRPEKNERQRKWVSTPEAAECVDEAGLSAIIRQLDIAARDLAD